MFKRKKKLSSDFQKGLVFIYSVNEFKNIVICVNNIFTIIINSRIKYICTAKFSHTHTHKYASREIEKTALRQNIRCREKPPSAADPKNSHKSKVVVKGALTPRRFSEKI